MSGPRSVLVVGASLAGSATARALRQLGYAGTITIVGDEPHRPYDRPPLSKEFLAGTMSEAELSLEMPGEDLQADWRLGTRALALDAAARSVILDDGTRLSADAVVIATGAAARRLPDRLAGLHTLRTLDDAVALRRDLQPGSRLAVIGAGFIGAEIASTASGLGLDVTVVEAAPAPLAGPLGVELGRAVAGLHEQHGVRLRCGVAVTGPTGTDRVTGLELADGTTVEADVVVAGIGAVPAVDWLAGSGLDVSAGVVCSSTGATEVPGVWAVGDCSAWHDPRRGHPHRVEHWTDARDRPTIVAQDLLGLPTSPLRAPYFWSDQYGVRLQFAGWHLGGEQVTVEAGSAATGDLLAVYRDERGEPTAVLGMNQPKLFQRVRKSLSLALEGSDAGRRNR